MMTSEEKHERLPRTQFGYITADDISQVQALLTTAAEVFDTEQEPSQAPADLATFRKLNQLSTHTIGVEKTLDGQIVAWCTAFPTKAVLMRRFLDGAITERSLFEQTDAGDTGAVYVMSVYIFPEQRGTISPERLVRNTVAPLLHVPAPVFYQGLTEQGARLGALLQKKFGRRGYQVLRFK